MSRLMSRSSMSLVVLAAALAAPFGCGKDSDDDATAGGTAAAGGSAGSAGSTRGGSGGRPTSNTSGTGPSGCEGISPKTGEACDDTGIVCPSQLGSCVCRRQGWECFEISGGEGGSGAVEQGGAATGGAPAVGGEAGGSIGGEPAGGQSSAGAAGADAGAGGEG
jgi:hypothetical protein